MRLTDLLRELHNRDIRLFLQEGRLRCEAPRDSLTQDLRSAIATHNTEIRALLAPKRPDRPIIERVERDRPLPLSFAQQRLWFLSQLDPQGNAYNIPAALRLRGHLDRDALARSFNEMVDRHEVLRTTILLDGGTPVQEIWPCAEVTLSFENLSNLSREDALDKANDIALTSAQEPFSLDSAPLLRVTLVELPRTDDVPEHILVIVFHHIVTDDWSSAIFFRELAKIYAAFSKNAPSPLPLPTLQYADFAVAQRKWISGQKLEDDLRYWRATLANNLPALDLPMRRAPDGARRQAGAELHFEIPEAVQRNIRGLSEASGYTRFVYFLSVYFALLFRYTNQRDISIGTPIANRHIREVEDMMGFFVNTLVFRSDLSGNPPFSDLLAQIQTISLEAQAHQDLPFERLVEALGTQARDGNLTPLFRLAFVFHNIGFEDPEIPGFEVEALKGVKRSAVFDLVLHIAENDEGLKGWLEYDPDLFADSTVAQMARCYTSLLAGAAANPATRLSELPLLDAQDSLHSLSIQTNARARTLPSKSISRLFEIRAAATPCALAVVSGDTALSYGELNARANRLAHRLIALGVEAETLVGVCVDRSIETIVAILAVLKAGGAYVPLDPDYPQERLAYMIEDAEPVLVLTKASLRERLPAVVTALCLDSDASIDRESDLNPPNRTCAANLAYVIYTSGSTGRPKGVAVTHGNVLRLFKTTEEPFAFSSRDVWTLFHSYAFDFSVWEIWGALLYGGKLVVVPYWVTRSPEAFHDLLAAQSVTILNQTPSSFYRLDAVDAAKDVALPSLRLVIFGGEALDARRLTDWFERHGDERPQLVNMYGITETTVHVTLRRLRAGEAAGIGVPIDDLQAYILDRYMNLTPEGVSGELFIGGAGLARGYLRRPALTAERFVPNPFSAKGERLYRTGDLGRCRDRADIDYSGRIDHQVKIRGFRIELGEIEATLLKIPEVRNAVVLDRTNSAGEQQIVAYLAASADLTAGALREAAGRDLPDYMIPSRFVFMDELPLTSNGKVDRANLPPPEETVSRSADYIAPRSAREDVICHVWAEALGHERVGIADNFFELGGHSLLAMTLIERMRQAGVHTDVRTLFTNPTPEELAKATGDVGGFVAPDYAIPTGCTALRADMFPLARISQSEVDRIVGTVPGGAGNVQDIYPLAPLQEGILFHHLASEGAGDPYLIPTVLAFDSRERVDAFCDALRSVIARHDILRTSIMWEGLREPMQVVLREAPLVIEEIQCGASSDDVAGVMIDRFSPRNYRLDVRQAPMVRLFLARDATNDRWILSLLNHHLVDDVSSLRVIFQEIAAAMAASPSTLPAAIPFRNFVAQARFGVPGADHETFFEDMLADVSEPTAPFGLVDVQSDGWTAREAYLDLQPELSTRMRSAARALGVSPASLCHQAFAHLLARVSGSPDVVFGTVLFGRMHGAEGAERAIGIFINTLPIRVRLGLESVSASVRKTHDSLTQLLRHEHASLALAQRCSRVAAPAPLFSALLNYRHALAEKESRDGVLALSGVTELYSQERSNFPFDLSVDDFGDGFRLTAQTQDPANPERVCAYMASALEALVKALEEAPQTSACAIDALDDVERTTLSLFGAGPVSDPPGREDPVDLFVQRASDAPNAIALLAGGTVLSYGALNRRSDAIAARLADLGAGPETIVGVCLERSIDAVAAILGALKAGAAYLPLDPAVPPERLSYMIADARPVVVISKPEFEHRLPPDAPRLLLNEDLTVDLDRRRISPQVQPDNLAYVIYTSGSSGKPKGVAISRRSLANLTRGQIRHHGFSPTDRLLQLASLSFDMSVEEIFPALCSGATLVLAPARFAESWDHFHALLHDGAVTFVNAPTAVWRDYANWFAANDKKLPVSLRAWAVGGEAADLATLRLWRALDTLAVEWTNSYGPTETTVNAASYRIDENDTDLTNVPIGRAVDNTQLYILDRWGEPAPVGVAGEICVAGVQVGRGYLGRPDLTAAAFRPDPYGPPGGRLYRTGDLGRYRADGVLDFLGRVDHQVKIRGHRIEPGEVEAALATHPELAAAAVVARQATPGVYRLVAYVVGDASPDALRRHLQETLPDYMIPSAFVTLDALPLTPNGKVDRKALPEPDLTEALARRYVAPRNDVEEKLTKIWADVLRVPNVGINDNFFELGGHSLLAMNLIERLRQEGLSASIRNLFSHPTPERLAKVLGRAHENDIPPNLIQSSASVITPDMLSLVALSQEEINRIVAAVPGGAPNVQDIYPLTPLQEGLLFHHLSASAGDPYLMPLIIGFDARERLDAFMAALHAVIARHDILRTALFWEGVGEPLQIVWRDVSVVLEDVPLDPLGADPVQQLRTRFDPSAFRLDIRMAPMMRAFAAHDERQNRWLLMLIFHHLVSDHAADDVLLKEVRAHLDGAANWLPAPIPYRNFVARARFGGGADEHEAFFRNMLANYSEPASPFGLLERAKDSAPFHEAAIDLSPSLGARLRRQARALGVSVASLCHLAFAQLLSRASGRDDIVFGTVLFGRTEGGARIDDAVGMFINTLPLRAHLSNSPVAGAIHDLHALLSQLMTHERASLALAQRCSGVVAPTPLFCALLNYRHSQPEVSVERDTILPGAALLFAEERANYPLVLSIDDFGDRFRLMAQTRGVSPSMICNHMRTTFESLADALEHAPHTPVSGLEVFSPDQRLRLISEWSGAAVAFHEEKSIVELFEDCVADAPNAVAVAFRGEALTYKQLNERADLLAAHLMRCGVGLESVAGVCLERSFETIVVLLAILKTGGAYLPLDPDYPPERLSFMVADAAPAVIVTRTHLREALPSNGRILDLDQKRSSADFSSRDRKPRINAQNIAYVTYTSGSTGRPKGVAVTHLAVLRLAKDERLAAIGEARNAVLQHSPLAFDASTFEIWVPLLNGGRIAIAPADARSGDEGFGQALRHDQVTTLWLTAALFHRIVEDRLSDLKGVKRLLVGGDVVSQTHANKLLAAYPWMELWNGYGPTENTTFSTLHRISPSIDANIPIGRPICGSTVYILDKKLDPMPVGAIGELYVGGAGLARGYSGRSDLTAERFVPNLFGAEGERLYRTGDLARFNEAGELEFLGRADRQLKIRGFRIEPGEIEAALTSLTQIREAVVIPREDSQGERRLAAYVVMTEGYADDAEDLRKVLARSLPSFMLPSRIVAVDAIPITPSGKLDRAALANISDQPSPANVFIAPRNSVEWLIAREFSNVLGVDRVGVEDNFFELGGHSLSAMRLAERIRRTLGRKLSPTAIFEAPTVSAIAAVLRDQVTSTSLRVELNGGGATPPLYCVHPAGGSVMRYRELAEALDGVSPVIGLQSRALSDSAHVDVSIDDMASAYVTEIRSGHPSDTPYCLVGWSSGGVIVAAMAEKLEALGERVAFLGIVDSYAYPDEDEFADHTPLESFIELAGLEGVDAKAALSEADRTVLIEARSGRTVREQYVFAAEWGVARGYLCDASPELIDAIYSDMENTVRLIRAHDLRDVSCPLHFWRARRSGCSPIAPWRRIAGGGVDVVDIDNDHDGVVADPALIAEIRENMNRIDREWRRYAATPEMRPDHMGRRSADSKEEAGY